MSRRILVLLEIIWYCAMVHFVFGRFEDRFSEVQLWAIYLIPVSYIVVTAIIQEFFRFLLEDPLSKRYGKWGIRLYDSISCVVLFLVSLGAFYMLEVFANMPASFETLCFISVIWTIVHMVIGNTHRIKMSRYSKSYLLNDDEYLWEDDELDF